MSDEYKKILVGIGDTLELLVYPYLIESNTVMNLLRILSGIKIKQEELRNISTHDVLFIARKLKNNEYPYDEIKKIVGDAHNETN